MSAVTEEKQSTARHFNFHFHVGFDLYVAVRCGEKKAFDELVEIQADPLACGYLSMSLARSENSAIPKDIPRSRELSKKFLPHVLQIIDSGVGAHLADAYYLLGFCYQEGYNYIKDMKQAVRCYKEAANLGHPGASVNLSNCYDSGDGVELNKNRVFELDTFAADLGHPIAINNLGCCYLFGKGCSVNHTIKIKMWKKASAMGYPMSQVNLGLTYYYGDGIKKDEETAVQYFRQAARHGLCRAQLMLAYCYYQSTGINGNRAKAIEYGRLSAAQGNANAQYLVGCMLYYSSPAEAVTFFQDSANGGNANAQFFIGNCYRLGDESSIPKSIVEAVRVFRKASAQNHSKSALALTELEEEYKNELWVNRRSFWMFLTQYQFITPAVNDTGPCCNSIHEFFYITDLCIFLSTFI